ncbi:MAG: methyltransferase domain-containing protein [archaeon]|nr:MAG: methyltransferase domain-containing protein [archaeon]
MKKGYWKRKLKEFFLPPGNLYWMWVLEMGFSLKSFQGFFKNIVAVEPSKKLFDKINSKCSGKKFSLINKNFENFNTPKKFDFVLASYVIHYFKNPVFQLKRIKSMLKPGGKLLLISNMPDKGSYGKFYIKFKKMLFDKLDPCVYNTFPGFLRRSGFKFKKLKLKTHIRTPNKKGFLSMVELIFDIDQNKISKKIKDQMDDYLKKRFGNGPTTFDLYSVIFVCSKR